MKRPMNHSTALRGLYVLTPDTSGPEECLRYASAALRGGARILQYRDKTGNTARQEVMAKSLRRLTRDAGALLIVNDSLPLALAVDADGVHLGRDDGLLAEARQALGPDKILGASCYADFELARKAVQAGADYVAFGAVFASPTKPHAVRASLDLFERCRSELKLPSCAIGGITLENAPTLIAAGADMLAVITDIFETADPEAITARARAYQPLFRQGDLT